MTEQSVAGRVVVEIDIEASPEQVFAALIEPESVVDWWGEEDMGYRCTAFRSDPRSGGRWWSEHRGKATDPVCIIAGEYVAFDSPHRLAFTWRFEKFTPKYEAYPVTTVTIELESRGAATHVRLTHEGFEAGSGQAEDHEQGWQAALSGLRRFALRAA